MRAPGFVAFAVIMLWAAPVRGWADARIQTPANGLEQTEVFISGQDGYHTFRIPSVIATAKGTLLAFAEGRKGSAHDTGDIDLVLKRSHDQGKTWQPMQRVWDDGANTCGNPCPVLDRNTGTIWLLMTWNRGDDSEPEIIAQTSRDTRRVRVCSSRDDGVSWSEPVEITRTVKQTNWTWYATGPGAGIQIERGPYRHRLVIPCDHIEAGTRHYYSHVIFSDDAGRTWNLGGRTPQPQVNECELVELSRNRLRLNMRSYDRSQHARQTALSHDGGCTWGDQKPVLVLIEPICQASIRRYSWPDKGRESLLLFSNPASTRRERMTIRLSYDEGESWLRSRLLYTGPSAYSCLVVLPDGTVGCLYERGVSMAAPSPAMHRVITFARFTLEWLTGGIGQADGQMNPRDP